MASFRILAIYACALFLAGCGTPLKTFKAPSDAKVKAATSDLNVKAARSRDTAAKAKRAAEEAKALHDQAIKHAGTVKELLDKLALQVPDEYKGPVRQASEALDQLIADNTALDTKLKELLAWNLQLEKQLAETEKARQNLQTAQDEYAGGAAALAQDATDERKHVVQLEGQLTKQKIIKLLWKIGGGVAITAILIGIGLAIVGKLGWALGKIGLKAAV